MADDPVTIKALEKISAFEAEIMKLKIFVNEADKLNGLTPRFNDLTATPGIGASAAAQRRWQAGEFFNKPLSSVVRQILLARAEIAGGPAPASVEDIHEALFQGTFNFESSGAEAQKAGIRISLGKNSATFVRLPNTDLFGLVEWYGKKPGKPGRKAPSENGTASPAEPSSTTEETTEAATIDDGEEEQAAA
jgi:hypothetical protein